jgi:putative SOS response-associated peptidase YedK
MPVILRRDDYDLWLDPGMRNVSAACELLKSFSDREMRKYSVSRRVNRVVNDDEACVALRHPIKRMT